MNFALVGTFLTGRVTQPLSGLIFEILMHVQSQVKRKQARIQSIFNGFFNEMKQKGNVP